MNRHLLLALFTLWLSPSLPLAQDLVPEEQSAVLLDQGSGRILFQKQPDLAIPPASLTKVMTLHLAWKALQEGRVQPSDLVPLTAETTGKSVPPGSSLMFLEPGQRVTVREIMLGIAVDSGNDAGLTLAQLLGGSQQGFVAMMNHEAQALGLSHTLFFDSYGYDARNLTTDTGWNIQIDQGLDIFQQFDDGPFSLEQAIQEARLSRGVEVVAGRR